jgi:uncharacterized protein
MFITHYDADGKGCLVLGKKFIKHIGKYQICDYGNVNGIVENYLDAVEQYNNDDLVLIITDISVSEEVAKRINDMKDKFQFLMLIDHHPSNNYFLKKYEWCRLHNDDISATKGLYDYLKEISLVTDDSYDEFVNAIDEWDTWKWEDTGNENAKLINDLAYNLKTHDFLNRFLINPSLALSKKEKLILGMREDDIQAMIEKIKPIFKGNTCYIFADKYIAEITIHIFEKYKNTQVIIVINPVSNAISYRSRSEDFDVSRIARNNGGGGHTKASGSPIAEGITEKLIGIILKDGFVDYTTGGRING